MFHIIINYMLFEILNKLITMIVWLLKYMTQITQDKDFKGVWGGGGALIISSWHFELCL